eukprot:gnl/Trimastix_PCT/1143.p1 GENE.gnl/Trimastix_PCT/1143~~gnl/Trimastix_PCT/1143.p1  ORF type:complete len:298 (-),score=73.55 gnl/Trimastix_PCT/1143:107-1000(-)
MSTETVSLTILLSNAIDVAKRAGKTIVETHRQCQGDLGTQFKSVGNPVTLVDLRAQQHIEGLLRRSWPNLRLIGEESVELDADMIAAEGPLCNDLTEMDLEDVPAAGITIWIDPLDGTKDFVAGRLEMVSVLIGIAVDGQARCGVIHRPFTGTTAWGAVGHGVRGVAREGAQEDGDSDVCRVATSISRRNAETEALLARMEPCEVIACGGFGNKVLSILEGRFHCLVSPCCNYTSKWDTCAPEALARAAGGWLSKLSGEAYMYGSDAVLENRDGVVVASAFGRPFLARVGVDCDAAH